MQITELDCPTHEALYRVADEATGLTGYIAIHSTLRGPAAGGLRFRSYGSEAEAIADVLKLSRGMTYKNAAAGLPLGGGKAVIIGNPATGKTRALLRAFGEAIQSLGGRYWTAEDMGMTAADMEVLAETTRFVAGRPGRSGDPSPATALGVFKGMQVALRHAAGSADLAGRTVAVQGLGNVGRALAGMLAAAGAKLIVADLDRERVADAHRAWAAEAAGVANIHLRTADIFAPCAIGGILNADTIPGLGARIVAGSANNQLATPEDGARLAGRGVLYAPDYLINCGGVVSVAAEILDIADREAWLAEKLDTMAGLLDRVLARARATGRSPADIADEIVEEDALGRAA